MRYKIGIIGIGFMGGSLIKSLSKSNKIDSIIAYDKNIDSLKKAYNDGVINKYSLDVDDSFSDCDIIFICTPAGFIAEYAFKLEKIVNSNCIITDIGSTKNNILEKVKDIKIEFIGAHPMVGSERSGYETSKDFLFENTYYIITKTNINKENSLEKLKEVILELKAIPIIINDKDHDYIVSVISHVPHIVAATLVNLVKNLDNENHIMKTLAAGGFKDITRIASSDPTMWTHICKENKEEIVKVLDIFNKMINDFRISIVDEQKTYKYFEDSKNFRDSFISKKINGNTMPELDINIKDENGAIASVTTLLSINKIGIRNIEVVNNRENNYGALKIIFATYDDRKKAFNILTEEGFDVKEIE